ncbi:hypothetical protein [uncultured Desulfobacter sp.]|uniref:hypothetical protein n=1 Tax=uncultured Desulfobacter sp. TaxID=240139 RepID=UPI002AAB9739|nr:hypothetical protein [uncultured Desulfobacter sp.]
MRVPVVSEQSISMQKSSSMAWNSSQNLIPELASSRTTIIKKSGQGRISPNSRAAASISLPVMFMDCYK